MKKLLTLALTAASMCVAFGVSAQQNFGPQWGATPEEQQQNVINYNFFRDAYNNQDYNEAARLLPELLQKAPKAHQNIYINGINVYKDKILKASSLADKNRYVDSLMLIYDLRVENFGDDPQRGKPYILQYKAQDYLTFKPADREGIVRYFKDAVDANGDNVDVDFVNMYFKELTDDYKADFIEADQYLEEYDRLEAIMNLAANADKKEAKTTFEALFISSGAANCENLEKMFGARIDSNPTDVELMEKAVGLLTRGNCKGDFYFSVAEKLYAANPTSNTAMILAAGFEEKKDYAKSLQYLNAAISNESDPEIKANLAVRIAGSELGAGNARSAADFARQAIGINPNSGFAYYILAQAYASGARQCSGFEASSVYWLVYDTLSKARSLLAESGDLDQVRDIDSQLGSYRASFPSKEECFFRGLNDGQPYTVRCGWVSGGTTVRQGR